VYDCCTTVRWPVKGGKTYTSERHQRANKKRRTMFKVSIHQAREEKISINAPEHRMIGFKIMG
jgi:hypothetical protein